MLHRVVIVALTAAATDGDGGAASPIDNKGVRIPYRAMASRDKACEQGCTCAINCVPVLCTRSEHSTGRRKLRSFQT